MLVMLVLPLQRPQALRRLIGARRRPERGWWEGASGRGPGQPSGSAPARTLPGKSGSITCVALPKLHWPCMTGSPILH